MIDRKPLTREVVRALVFKTLALLAIYLAFFGIDRRTIVTGSDIGTSLFHLAPLDGEH